MAQSRHLGRKAAGLLATSALALSMGLAPHGVAAGAPPSPEAKHHDRSSPGEKRDYDARQGIAAAGKKAVSQRAARATSRPATQRLRSSLGDQALVEMDGTTGTPRIVARLDGFLTAPSSKPASRLVMDYVTAHLAALGLTSDDLATFRLTRDYRDVAGIHHLSWTQWKGSREVFGNGLQANVTKTGRLLSLGGSPISGLFTPKKASNRVATRDAAISAARADLSEPTSAGPRDTAKQVIFVSAAGSRLAWQVVSMSAAHPTLSVIDASSGAVVYRRSLGDDAVGAGASNATAPRAASTGLAFDYFPRHQPGGTPHEVDFTARGWLPATASELLGNNSHTYADVNDNNKPSASEEIPPSSPHSWNYTLKPFDLPDVSFCNNPYPCSWDPNTPFSWRTNKNQNATQVFYFVNTWHDHLRAAPIGFTEAAGNFQTVNSSGRGAGGDAVDTQTDDGANTDAGLPDGSHIDNANMDTPPDGQAPTMQMFLQHQPGTPYPDGDPFSPTNVGDEADTVYHEYTHGLSNRLVVDATGGSTLGDVQAGAMGEAWSDWYAMDYLVDKQLQQDQAGKADLQIFQYDGDGVFLDRTQPLDCKVNSKAPLCTGGTTGHSGGYTYADYGNIVGGPEVHGDGELWTETLWDLRDALGSATTESLVTRAMELSPSNPSYLDERNSILLADNAAFGGRDRDAIWKVFAHRGMGFFAGSLTGDDTSPGADFHTPPANQRRGTITGTVTDADSGQPVGGLTVALAFQGAPGDANPATVTAADGTYSIGPVPVGTYPKLSVSGAGYDPARSSVTVTAAGVVKNFTVRRDWAASSGGASIRSFTGPDFGPGCDPAAAIDNSQANGWVTSTGSVANQPSNTFVPHNMVIRLPQAIDVTQFAFDPASACGLGGSASTGGYRIETSPNGSTWTTAATGTFTIDDRGVITPVTPTAGTAGVRFVRITPLSNQTPDFATNCPDGAFDGCTYTSLTEVEVYGDGG
jgi:extracellular elastinolytic metalloproteinase